ncbi:sugar ABC transporter substrate-binding protein [Campylobacter sp. MIT 21-1685]|uniref:sugar ABC transporter substrate-binding protein n=1 Tax=unclassified Campylobacter TaxID=2593542 RepID=UPI00224A4DDF|nr:MULTISPECIES: sugar ABC transporter substrate-binding protein [unclassified Campylobacter]MCX2682505.1 sugar ABC transporter substrate-binding protein [Campylobacter sp. MIT 21-1684]MCX2750782.1 sugar ABC transporter substrate-binding protein [Campylobacter sp. MIT 21-1682]MCX2806986.1 sugar ABC transporter substrate-binding protein [Campylobacter sp. MIT 21-1685]
MLNKVFLMVLCLCTLALAKDINIVFVTHGTDGDPFWSVFKNGVSDAAKETKVKVDYRNPANGDKTEMARLIQSAVSKRPDGLIVTIPDKNALSKDIKKARDLNIPVIVVNSGEEVSKELGTLMYIGSSEYKAGLLAGKKAKEAGVKSFVCVNHEITNTVLEQRCQGFADGLGIKNNMIDTGYDPSEIQKRLEPYLKNVDAILTIGPISASATIDLLKKKRIEKYFATFDLSKEITQAIKDNVIQFAIDQQQYLQGYLPIIFLAQYAKYGVIPSVDVLTGPAFVDKNNVKQVEELAGTYR